MDLFTQSVDAALWSSRAFDDPSYDHDVAAAAEAISAVSFPPLSAPPPPTLVVAVGPVATAAVTALSPSPASHAPLTALTGAGVARTLLTAPAERGPLAACSLCCVPARGVPAARAAAWATALLAAARARRVLVLAGGARAASRGEGRGVRALRTTAAEKEGKAMAVAEMREPEFVEGCAAAVMAEVEENGGEGVCLVQGLERANFGVDEAVELAATACSVLGEWGERGGEGVAERGVGEEGMRRLKHLVGKSAVAAHDSIYL